MNERPEKEGIDLTVVDPAAESQDAEAPADKPVSTFRLVATLAVAGALAGLLIVLVNLHTKPIIDEYRAEQLKLAVYEVLPGVSNYRTLYRVDGNLVGEVPAGSKASDFRQAYIGYDENGEIIGAAVSRGESGFADIVLVIFGFEPDTGILLGKKVLESKETPGLGDKIFKDQDFVQQFFDRPQTPLTAIKAGTGKGLPGEIDAITGATISSKVVVSIINNGVAEWRPMLQQVDLEPLEQGQTMPEEAP
ncbi:MAG: FMN-binding protein [Xanthomonadales bacterium]|nr:FMN-binding protein [Gammaproteobacteria bacterium]MBT8057532.1 FMN-binding protein [Gammaproteobacteria bacterium]NNJ79199.1 FMN-binding protein [Xanthomonadales bacterium]NNK37890.1 FMN-binding protein [Xanthomonadales bacterium]